jgi:hypothetical protein
VVDNRKVELNGIIQIFSFMKILAIVILTIGIFVVGMQQANADNNGDGKKSCNDHHNSASAKCSHKDTTPLILPFP